jgi:hypothetical protein
MAIVEDLDVLREIYEVRENDPTSSDIGLSSPVSDKDAKIREKSKGSVNDIFNDIYNFIV